MSCVAALAEVLCTYFIKFAMQENQNTAGTVLNVVLICRVVRFF